MTEIAIYHLLNKVEISAVKTTQLNEMTSRTAVDQDAVKFWSSVITVARAIGESRTFAHGLPIYETGTVVGSSIDDGANATYTPPGSEVWLVMMVDAQGCAVALRDGDGNMCQIAAAGSAVANISPLYLSSTMSIFFDNATGSSKTPNLAYLKVSL